MFSRASCILSSVLIDLLNLSLAKLRNYELNVLSPKEAAFSQTERAVFFIVNLGYSKLQVDNTTVTLLTKRSYSF